MTILQTNRLELRTIKEEDINYLYKNIFSNKEIMKYALFQKILSKKETIKFIEENFAKNSSLGLAIIVLKETSSIIGCAGIIRCEDLGSKEYEIGFIIEKKHQGYGYAYEIGKAQIDYCKEKLKAKRALALVNKENLPSKKVIKKLNMNYLTTIKKENRGYREVYTTFE